MRRQLGKREIEGQNRLGVRKEVFLWILIVEGCCVNQERQQLIQFMMSRWGKFLQKGRVAFHSAFRQERQTVQAQTAQSVQTAQIPYRWSLDPLVSPIPLMICPESQLYCIPLVVQLNQPGFCDSKDNIYRRMSKPKNEHDLLAKVIIIGDSGVGKSNLLTKFCDGVFKDSYVATIGVDFKLKTIQVDDSKIKLQIWDTAGQERFRNITQTYYKGAAGIILAYAVNNKQSFKSIASWVKQIESNTSETVRKILIATKCDLEHEREVEEEEGKMMADKHNMLFLEVSAKNGHNVDEAFTNLTKQIRNHRGAAGPPDDDTINLRSKDNNSSKKKCSC